MNLKGLMKNAHFIGISCYQNNIIGILEVLMGPLTTPVMLSELVLAGSTVAGKIAAISSPRPVNAGQNYSYIP